MTLFGRHAMIIKKVAYNTLESNNNNWPVLHMNPPFKHISKSRLMCY